MYTKKPIPEPRSFFQFLPKGSKEVIKQFDITHLNWNLEKQNYLNLLWILGVIADEAIKFPERPTSCYHKEALEKVFEIFEEWKVIDRKLNSNK